MPLSPSDVIHRLPTRPIAASLAVVLLLVAVLHAYWGLGGRWGLAQAVGGSDAPIPPGWLIWIVVGLLVAALLAVLGRAGFWGSRVPSWVFVVGTWALALALLVAALLNFLAATKWEVFVFGPVALVRAVAAAVVASAPPDQRHS
jgi:hypothetical protein